MGHIIALGVAPERQRRGLAHLLLLEMERNFRSRGISTVRLEVRVENVAALRLYESLGYMVAQRLQRYYSTGSDGYLMVKSLSA